MMEATVGKISREALCAEASTWVGTPYHHLQHAKGLGADCIGLIIGIAKAVGILASHWQPWTYSAEWHVHNSEELLRGGVLQYGCTPVAVPQHGDILLFRFAHAAAHSAILMPGNTMIHAVLNKQVRQEPFAAKWRDIFDSAYAFPGVAVE